MRQIERIISNQESRIKALEIKAREQLRARIKAEMMAITGIDEFPCCINEGRYCREPFCKYTYFTLQAEKAKDEWIKKCKEEIAEYNSEGKAK